MSDPSKYPTQLPPEQQAIRAKCFHPTGTFVEFKRDEIEQSIPNRFEKIVRQFPDRVAVKTHNSQWTYDELNKASNRVAHAILAAVGEANEPIALLIEQGASLIAAIIGILKAGKIYVPLDRYYPYARLTFMLEDSQPKLMITNDKNLSLAQKCFTDASQFINIDEIDSNLSTDNPNLSISPDSLAWIIYTSGSTGQPKGVVQNHRNVLHDIMQYTNTFHICPEDRTTFLYSYSVYGAVRGIFGALLNGATLYPLDIRDEGFATLANLLSEEEITFYLSVPTVFRNFVSTLTGKERFPRLRLIRFGGEQVLARDVELYKKHFPDDCLLYTGMGATETGQLRQYFINKQTQIIGSVVPTGYPVEDKEVGVLDDAGEEIGFNHVGEIAVKSRYLSPGYWRRPDLTRASFLPDPEEGNERIYCTGDLGLMRSDGCLEFLGRKDFQVKIRGYRVEVDEVESTLLALDNVKEAVVVAREGREEEKNLVAYIVPDGKFAVDSTMLRRALRERLPEHMVPAAFVVLDTMPLTPNGKIDRRAVPDPGRSRPELDTTFVTPRTSIEQKLAQIWVEVLSLDRVGIHDNFFDLGGHSLSATRVVSQVIKQFQLEIPLKYLFESPTVAAMAAVVTEYQAKKIGEPELKQILAELESISEEKARQFLADAAGTNSTREPDE